MAKEQEVTAAALEKKTSDYATLAVSSLKDAAAATEAQNKQKREYEARLASIRNTLQNTQRQLEEEQRTSAGMKGEARTRFDTFVQDIERITGEKESITDAKVCEPLLASNERQRRLGSRMTSTMRRSSPRSYNPRWIALTH